MSAGQGNPTQQVQLPQQQSGGGMNGQNLRQMFANGNRPQGGAGGHQMFANNQQQQWQPKQPMQQQQQQWQPQNLQQAWGQMNNPNQFSQQQAMMQQALRQRQAQTMQNMPQRAVGSIPQPVQQPGVDPRNLGVLGGWDNYVG